MAKKALDKINDKTDKPIKLVEREVSINKSFADIALKNKPGHPARYNPEQLYQKAIEYMNWAANNPLVEQKAFGTGMIANMNKLRVMTVVGFCVYAGFSTATFYEYEKKSEYADIVTRVKEAFRTQNLDGAAAGLLEPNIIARLNGLTDKQEIKTDTQVTVNITLPENGKGFNKELKD